MLSILMMTLERIRKNQKLRQQKYVQSKINRGFIRIPVWLNCDRETMLRLKAILVRLSSTEIHLLIDQYDDLS